MHFPEWLVAPMRSVEAHVERNTLGETHIHFSVADLLLRGTPEHHASVSLDLGGFIDQGPYFLYPREELFVVGVPLEILNDKASFNVLYRQVGDDRGPEKSQSLTPDDHRFLSQVEDDALFGDGKRSFVEDVFHGEERFGEIQVLNAHVFSLSLCRKPILAEPILVAPEIISRPMPSATRRIR
ncbi:MAG TPA: hypothetical protein DIT55_07970 [Spirochaetaceae bacterium]|nr:hypothetical protein [Spirochaetaceae bacterium]